VAKVILFAYTVLLYFLLNTRETSVINFDYRSIWRFVYFAGVELVSGCASILMF